MKRTNGLKHEYSNKVRTSRIMPHSQKVSIYAWVIGAICGLSIAAIIIYVM